MIASDGRGPVRNCFAPRSSGKALVCLFSAVLLACSAACSRPASRAEDAAPESREHTVAVQRGDFRHSLRLSGTVGAVHSYSVQAPRLAGQMASTMVITSIVRNGAAVRAGDILVELDRQSQLKSIQDKQAEYDNLVQQILKKQADHAAALAADETELKGAEVDVRAARVEMRKNDVVPGYQAEINKVNLAEAEAKLKQLKDTAGLKGEARAAEMRVLEIQRDRAKRAVEYAQGNIESMTVISPMAGLAVLTPVSKGSRMVDPQEGDEVRSGGNIMVVVNPAEMQVTARVNQVDIAKVHAGQPAEIRLDAYPGLVFPGKVERIGAIGTSSTYLKRIRYFSVVVSIQGSNPKLLPDLTAAVDLELANVKGALTIPREAVFLRNAEPMVEVIENGRPRLQAVRIGPTNECDSVVESGLREGTIVSLRPRSALGSDMQGL